MFLEAILIYIQAEPLVEVLKEDSAHIIAFTDDDCILFT